MPKFKQDAIPTTDAPSPNNQAGVLTERGKMMWEQISYNSALSRLTNGERMAVVALMLDAFNSGKRDRKD